MHWNRTKFDSSGNIIWYDFHTLVLSYIYIRIRCTHGHSSFVYSYAATCMHSQFRPCVYTNLTILATYSDLQNFASDREIANDIARPSEIPRV